MKTITFKHYDGTEYKGTLEFSNDDKIYFGKVLDMPGLIMYSGDTEAECIRAFADAIHEYKADEK